jgi:peptidoglycan/LPS O-acetylase OafA/YrhL
MIERPQRVERMARAHQGYLHTLDGWRALAILAVMVDHFVAYDFQGHPTIFRFTRIGANGVSLFFAISGFLICSRLLEEQALTGRISLPGFYIRRACRILPAAMTYLLFIGVLALLGFIVVDSRDWTAATFFWRNYLSKYWIRNGWGGYTLHYWSLAVEEHFYLIWPGLLVACGKRRAQVLAIVFALTVAGWRWWDFHHHWFAKLLPGVIFEGRTDVRLDGLLLGCVVALWLDNPAGRAWAKRYFTFWPWLLCVIAYSLFTIVARQHQYTVWESALLPLMVAGTVLQPDSWVSRLLEHSVLRWIGRLSYSLYLWQQLFVLGGERAVLRVLQIFPLNFAMIFLCAFLSYELIERPFIRLGHRWAPPPTPGRADLGEVAPTSPNHVPV